jgi:hypothetical protein
MYINFHSIISIYNTLNYYSIERDANKILIFTHNLYMASTLVYIHELVVRARQLASVAQRVWGDSGSENPEYQVAVARPVG